MSTRTLNLKSLIRDIPDWPKPLPLAGVDEAATDERRPIVSTLAGDLRTAKDQLDQRLGKDTRHLAFPQYVGTDSAIQTARNIGYRGFFWGVLPRRPLNRPGDPPDHIVRISGEFLRRLPGEGRLKLSQILRNRYGKRLRPA